MINGDQATAIRLYKEAIYQGSPTFSWAKEPQDWDTYEIAFAYFRLILIYYAQNDLEAVTSTQAEFAQHFPPNALGYEFQLLLDRFATIWEESGDVSIACVEAEALLTDLRSAKSDFNDDLVVISHSPIRGEDGANWCPF